jgi:endonuclease/exonuclease/phosphatase (EEP) superfamily protein YafD
VSRGLRLLATVSVALLAATLAATVDRWHWTIALTAHFPAQYLALSLLLGVAWLFVRPRRGWVVLCLVLTMALNAVALAPLFASRLTAVAGPGLRILSFNTWPLNDAVQEIWDYVEELQPDIAVLFETSEALLASQQTLSDGYRVQTVGEFIVLIAHGVEGSIDMRKRINHTVGMDVRHEGRRLQLIVAHPYPPIGPLVDGVDSTFEGLERSCREAEAPVVILGDLNCTPWSFRFRRLLERGRLIDSGIGRGLAPSFPAWPPLLGLPFGIPIDHCLLGAGLVCTRRELGPALGSNHRALVVELAWPGGGSGAGRD